MDDCSDRLITAERLFCSVMMQACYTIYRYSTLAYDRGVKTSLYASSGIPEYWLIDLEHRQVIFHRHPIENRYREIQTVENAGLTPVAGLEGVSRSFVIELRPRSELAGLTISL